ncbi:hypothetical protein HN51_030959 [Arachis hypogaea]|uniref:Uncharacterized protein n=1 Tax=Arachis hypogaea TaxID=3818 RepID=A0A445B942_ARAHY|nr:uncharacterized protein LOC112715161 isoform X1 [Arachis hypogaea]RYR35179.1 hypothetical protein Ahy_A10g050310 [Arachis hypogaea]
MEELRKLEKVQRMVQFMESRALLVTPSSNDHGHRFVANLMLFLLQPCGGGDLSINDKCSLLSDLMPRLSSEVLEEASVWISEDLVAMQENDGFQQNHVENAFHGCNQLEYNLLQSYNENKAMVSLDSMEKANSTLEDFCRSYFMFHELDVTKPQTVFKYLPILSFTESYIYQLDKMNEKLLPTPTNGKSVHGGKDEKTTGVLASYFSNDPVRPLVTLLKHKGLLTERIREELTLGEEYWALERKLCYALVNEKEILIEDVMKAIHLKSFDYRVLNLLLYQLRGAEVEELHMEFLSVSEFLVEVSDDLYDYEDDVLENNFNILRMFVRIYGASTAPAMLAKCIGEAEDKYESLLNSLDPQLSESYQKRCAEATKEGGKVSEHPLGTWVIPTVIPDEELYRSKLKSDTE